MMQQDTMPAERLESRDRAPVAQEVTSLSPEGRMQQAQEWIKHYSSSLQLRKCFS